MEKTHTPLADVRRRMRVKWYRSPIDKDVLRKLMQRSDLQGWFQSLGHLALWAGTGFLTYYLFTQQLWVAFALALFVHGTFASFFSSGCHELDHGTVFKTRWLNRFFLVIYSRLAWFNYHDYALSHTYHHRYTLHMDGDREVELPKTPSLRALYLLQLFTVNIFGGFMAGGIIPIIVNTVKMALRKFPRKDAVSDPEATRAMPEEWMASLYEAHPEELNKSVRWARITLLFHALVIVAAIVSQLWLLPVLISFSVVIANFWNYLIGVSQHCGLRDNISDFRKCTRSIKLDPLSEFLYWRMNWHMEHHMYAGVPCYNLSKLYAAVADDLPEPRSLLGAWREMRSTWKRQQIEPDYQYDTPLPSPTRTAEVDDREDDDELDGSIGDLAPGVLAKG